MSFASHMLGTFTFRRSTLSEIAESEDLTIRGWFLLIMSSIIAGLCISVYYRSESAFSDNLTGWVLFLFFTVLFCFFYGFDLAWTVVAVKKDYSIRSFLTIDGLKGLRDPDFQRAIRLMGYSSLVLVLSGIVLFTGIEFYQLPTFWIDFPTFSLPKFLAPFIFPFIMFLNPLEYPIVFFLVWQTIIFIYGYNIDTEEEQGKNIAGLIRGFIIFNFFWTVAFLLYIAAIIVLFTGVWIFWRPSKKKEPRRQGAMTEEAEGALERLQQAE